jgi:hypothetical protein
MYYALRITRSHCLPMSIESDSAIFFPFFPCVFTRTCLVFGCRMDFAKKREGKAFACVFFR